MTSLLTSNKLYCNINNNRRSEGQWDFSNGITRKQVAGGGNNKTLGLTSFFLACAGCTCDTSISGTASGNSTASLLFISALNLLSALSLASLSLLTTFRTSTPTAHTKINKMIKAIAAMMMLFLAKSIASSA